MKGYYKETRQHGREYKKKTISPEGMLKVLSFYIKSIIVLQNYNEAITPIFQ